MSSIGADILTYRYNGTMVYVTPAATYKEGVEYARQVFPELASVDPARISICINGTVNKQRQLIRIGAMAWNSVITSRARYEVIDIIVVPEIVVDADELSPPDYFTIKEKSSHDDFLAPSRAPSPRPVHKIIPVPGAPARSHCRSRSPSPHHSIGGSSTSSRGAYGWAKSLLGRSTQE
ncbi:hypothetical protein ONZ51_g4731 [Trametes cubensis]|uniref:Uncharacterized protein n=1 Tax=Trametes cubensis TaxID=1111947 RepID=A0AAD7TVA4_9APHY|nr:hypothetical protein ONZ51_g4731 [Trametes cubensis]